MSKYKVLWIDDKWEDMDSFKDRCEELEEIEIIPCKYCEQGMELFEKQLEKWSGVILDAKCLLNEKSKFDELRGLQYCIRKIDSLSSKHEVPYYIYTGQPGLNPSSSFAEEHEGHYYEKDADDDRLISDIKKNADELPEIRIIHRYQQIFDCWPECHHELLRIIKSFDADDNTNNSLFNDLRKVLSDVHARFYKLGYCSIEPNENGTNLAEASRDIGQREIEDVIPVFIQRAFHTLADVTNPGSHRSDTDLAALNGLAPYLIKSLTLEMLNLLYWGTLLTSESDKELVKKALAQAKVKYNKNKLNR